MATIQTKYGVFDVVDNENGGSMLFIGDKKICEFPKVAWWNADGLNRALEEHHELITKRIEERVNVVNVTRENAEDVIVQLIEVFGKEKNGFYSSRLTQCLNKLRA